MKKIFTILGITAMAVTMNAQNLISNGDLETWTDPTAKPDGWFSMNKESSRESTVIHGGQYSAKIMPFTTIKVSDGSIVYNNGNLDYSDVDATENTQYTVSYWILDNQANARSRHWIQFRTASANINITGNAEALPFQPSTFSSDSPEWVFVTATATTPANTTKLRFSFRTYAQNNEIAPNYVDDIQLIKGVLAVTDVKDFDKQVKMNTVVENELTLRLPERATVNVYSIDGKLVSSNRVSDNGTVNMQGLPKGNYIVTVDIGSAKISRKIIKK